MCRDTEGVCVHVSVGAGILKGVCVCRDTEGVYRCRWEQGY